MPTRTCRVSPCAACHQDHTLAVRYRPRFTTTEFRMESDATTEVVEYTCPIRVKAASYTVDFDGPVDVEDVAVLPE